jgi:hypothetical protein
VPWVVEQIGTTLDRGSAFVIIIDVFATIGAVWMWVRLHRHYR